MARAVLLRLVTVLVAFAPFRCTFVQAADVHLEFVKLSDGASVLPHGGGDGVQYSKVDVPDGFPFGRVVQNETYVVSSGYLSIDVAPYVGLNPEPFSASTYSSYVVAPFWANTSTSTGKISYEVFGGSHSPGVVQKVSSFISEKENVSFSGTWMLVTEWFNVTRQGSPSSSANNTFQGLVVTDGNQSYAVFIYKCGLLEWGKDAIIGFKADRTYFRNFVLSGVQANLTACLNAPDSLWKNLVYKLVRPGDVPCIPGEFGCDSGECVADEVICDGVDDCPDGSDEERGCHESGSCAEDEFTCDNNECIPSYWECDGILDCSDNSDENETHCRNRPCGSNYFHCGSGECIFGYWLCDDIIDCSDASDESNCGDCTSDEFNCNNGVCVHFASECDGDNDCGDNSDEDLCDAVEFSPCHAMQSISDSIEEASSNQFNCSMSESCLTVTCDIPDRQQLVLNLLNCNHPPGIQLINQGADGQILYNHTFLKSENVNGIVDSVPVLFNVTVIHLQDMIGIRLDASYDSTRETFIPYTLIRIESEDCYPLSHTPTCAAMGMLAHNLTLLYGPYFYCWTFDPCEQVKCIDDQGEGGFDITIIKCNKPPAVRFVYRISREEVFFDHTYTHSEAVPSNYSGSELIWNVTLVHMDDGIGFELRIGEYYTFIPYFEVPLDFIICPTGIKYLPFLDLGSDAVVLPPADDANSSVIPIPAGLPFGRVMHKAIYVITNGYLSFQTPPYVSYSPEPFSGSNFPAYVVSPYWSDIDTSTRGQVFYQVFNERVQSPGAQLEQVSAFVRDREKMDPSFSGTWMLAVQWSEVPQFGHDSNLNNTFQGLVITNGSQSYAVFTYKCGLMMWDGNATIGIKADHTFFRNHPLSNQANVRYISCLNEPSSDWSNEVYKLVPDGVTPCEVGKFGCQNGNCIPNEDLCNGVDDCGDGSDEPADCDGGHRCAEEFFTCGNSECIPYYEKCDGFHDCSDSSDEAKCNHTCPSGTFQCNNGNCIPGSWECDDIVDCADGSDEVFCGGCTSDEFGCANLKCVPFIDECNSYDNCGDNSDEESCGVREHSPCSAMQSVLANLEASLGSSWLCTSTAPCYDATCSSSNKVLKLKILWCSLPQAVLITHLVDGAVIFNHTFSRSEVLLVTLDGAQVQLNVTLLHHPELLGLRIEVSTSESRDIYVPYTFIRLETEDCKPLPNTSKCNAMHSLAQNLSAMDNRSKTCWTFDPCKEIHCIFQVGDGELQLVVDECNDPSSIEMIIAISRDVVWFDHTFTESEAVAVYYSSYLVVFNATVTHQSDQIGFKITLNDELFVPDSVIPTSSCIPPEPDHLSFIEMGKSATLLPRGDDLSSDPIDITVGLPFNRVIFDTAYVTTNGYFSFGDSPYVSCCPTLFSESYFPTYLVAPFWSNIDTSVAGNVSYRVITSGTSASLVKSVSDYVSRKMNTTFSGKWMIVAEWRHVHKLQAREPVLNNTFQGIVITDNSMESYAVFTYTCGSMEWDGEATIGFKADRTYFRNHPLSGRDDANSIACVNAPRSAWTNVVYRLVPEGVTPCEVGEYGCENGACIPDEQVCDGNADCADGTDEQPGCGSGSCAPYEFACDNGECIPDNWRCDGVLDCSDSSDEADCVNGTCSSGLFQCDSGVPQCIYAFWVCDDYSDCEDGSDEKGCPCEAEEFGCDNDHCIPEFDQCDGYNDCGDNSDEDFCSVLEYLPCKAMQGISSDLNITNGYQCTTTEPCNTLSCLSPQRNTLQLTLLKCERPTAIQLVSVTSNGHMEFNHTFKYSENLTTTLDGVRVNVSMILVHLPDLLGIQLKVMFQDRSRRTYIPYTLIRINTEDCIPLPDTPTCNATEKVVMNMSSTGLSCWTFDPCEEIRCLSSHGEDTLRVIMVKCNKPPAVRVVYTYANGRVWFDHTFTYSEAVTVYYSDFVFVWNVTLVQLENGIGFEIRTNHNTLLRYAEIPLKYTICPTDTIYLPFVELGSGVTVLPPGDDIASNPIDISNGLPFWRVVHNTAYVVSNGYFSFGSPYTESRPVPFAATYFPTYIVAPFWTDIDTSTGDGQVNYEVFDSAVSSSTVKLEEVSSFVSAKEGTEFSGSWMLVAEWSKVQEYHVDGATNTFQGLVITNGTRSYAVFTYKCGLMEWPTIGDATVGFKADRVYFRNNPISETRDPASIACENTPLTDWNNVVYQLVPDGIPSCEPSEFGCENGNCIPDEDICNEQDDCGDGSDEIDCEGSGCGPQHFTCENGECIPFYQRCDAIIDCSDASDESCNGSTCQSGLFLCHSGECIYDYYVCDDIVDCQDGSDEFPCPCDPNYEFSCNNGYCIPIIYECDVYDDCGDNSDEDSCGEIEYSPCEAMQHIQSELQLASGDAWICTSSPPCYTTTCYFKTQTLKLSLLRCNHPPAFQLIHFDSHGAVVFNHTFYRSDTITVTLYDQVVDLNVTVIHHPDLIGLMIEVHGIDGSRGVYVKYTLIRFETDDCPSIPDTPMCQSMQELSQSISRVNPEQTCWTFEPCEQVRCIENEGEGELQLIFLRCYEPIALRNILSISRDVVWFDHTFNQSETLIRYYGPYKVVIDTTLEQRPDGVLFGMTLNNQTFIPNENIILNKICPPELDFLAFIDMDASATPLERGDDDSSGPIAITQHLPFNRLRFDTVYVITNGYFSFTDPPLTSCCPHLFSSSDGATYTVAPFWSDIDTRALGKVSYRVITNANSETTVAKVSDFVNRRMNTTFSGAWMVVAEWYEVPKFNTKSNLTNTFQGIVITDNSMESYAIFTYQCGSMHWDGQATIGFKADDTYFRNHPLSGRDDADSIGCLQSPQSEWSNVVYRLVPEGVTPCDVGESPCTNANCVPIEQVCDGHNDCGDDSDEEGCPTEPSDCAPGQFECNSSESCISITWRCDGIIDCADHSDEINCGNTTRCPDGKFNCESGECIGDNLVCDGIADCQDKSDESDRTCKYLCKSDQFACNNDECVSFIHECDGENNCGDNSDEDICNAIEDVACKALEKIVDSFKRASSGSSWVCSITEKCDILTCTNKQDAQVYELTLLKCSHPPSFRLVNKDSHSTVRFNHTFDRSEVVVATIDGANIMINATVVQHPDFFGLRIEVINEDESRVVFVPYTLIRVDRAGCSKGVPDTPTCNAMKPVLNSLTKFKDQDWQCWMSGPCEKVECVNYRGGAGLDLSIMKCSKPRAIQLLLNASRTVVWLNHTITGSEIDRLIDADGTEAVLNVTVEGTDDGIGFELHMVSDLYRWDINRTDIPLNTSSCNPPTKPPPTTTCSTLHSIIDILENDVYVGQVLEKGTCSVNDCHQIHCGLHGGGDLYIEIEDCNDPPGMSLYITKPDNTTAFNETFTDGRKMVKIEAVTFWVRITQGTNTLEIQADIQIKGQASPRTIVSKREVTFDTGLCSLPSPAPQDDGSKGLSSTEMIIAIAVPAGVVGLVLLVVVVVCVVVVVRRRRKKNDLYEFQPMTFTNDSDGDDD